MSAGTVTVENFIDTRRFGRPQIVIVALCAIIAAVDGFDAQLMAFVAPALSASLHIAKPALGPIFSAGLFGMMFGSLIGGPLADRFGRKPVILLALAWFGVCSILTSQTTTTMTLMALRFLTGLGYGAAMPNAVALTSEYGQKRYRATMVMVMYCGFSLGAALGGPLTDWLLRSFSWSAVFVLGGATPLVTALFMLALLPESLRFLVVNNRPRPRIEKAMQFVLPDYKLEPGTTVVVEELERAERMPISQLFTHGRAGTTLLLWLMFGMGYLDLYLLNSWLPTIMHSDGVDLHAALLITSGFQIGGTIGTLLFGRIIDKTNPAAALGAIFIVGTACIFLIGNAGTSVPMLAIATFFAGACVVSGLIGLTAVAAALYPTAIRSTGVGWAIGTGRLGGVCGPMLGGFVLSLQLAPQAVFQVAAGPCFVAAIAALALMTLTRRQGERVKLAAE